MKQTKPAQAMELRSLSPVLGGPEEVSRVPCSVSARCAIFAVIAVIACGDSSRAEWRRAEEEAIVATVLRDLVQLPPDFHAPEFKPPVFCADVAESEHGPYRDAPAGALARLRAEGFHVVARSECEFPGYRLKADGTQVTLIGVSAIEWKADDFVKLQARRLIGDLAGQGYTYTLSRTPRGWQIDTARDTWVAEAAQQRVEADEARA
jgi:hypothetical protein